MSKKEKTILLLVFAIFIISSISLFSIHSSTLLAQTTDDLKEKIRQQQEYIKELEKQQQIYEANIKIKRKEALTLKNQISILTNQISRTRTEIKKKEAQIKKTNLEIEEIQDQIQNKNIEISDLKEKIAEFLRKIYQYDNKSYLEIILLNEHISDYFNLLKVSQNLQNSLQKTLDNVQLVKENLETEQKNLQQKKAELENLKRELSSEKTKLENEERAKRILLEETQGAEWKFQTLLAEAKLEMKQAEREIARLETEIRKKLAEAQERQWQELEEMGLLVFSWPVPGGVVTSTFHDPDYPFRAWLGEHSGIDIKASQGTAVRASAGGYVARAKHGGMGYSYVMIIHQQGFSTVYGHLLKINVEEGTYVKRGEVIGLSGGIPGTPGAGRFSTGPHLHFEIRKDGIPVNPLNYLP
ncbi:MAG: peptidoglycan DD-metalloendopeptidase family protein [Patescibacteria group bacterium]|nr:peptidoglycan DD-metalloendopeptidase family protein [Patescibacteria group bacterium]